MRRLIIQGVQFIGISGIGWIIDFIFFNLLNLYSDKVVIHNMVSSLIAVFFVFFMSTRKTFVQKPNGINIKLKFIIYSLYQILLIILISKVLAYINQQFLTLFADYEHLEKFSAMFAKILVTPFTMILNFIFMKLMIERM